MAKNIVYPEVAKLKNIEGTVYVRVLVDEEGNPEIVEIVKSDNQIFNESALTAVKKAKFTPGIQKGKPIAMWITIPISYRLK